MLTRAGALADQLNRLDVIERRSIVLDLIAAIRVHADRIEVDVLKNAIAGTPRNTGEHDDTVTLAEAATFARRGTELRLVLAADGPTEPEPDPALIKALAQAHRWWRDLTNGTFKTLREIAEAYDTDERYAAFVLRLAFLSPELTRQILTGTQPPWLTLHQHLWRLSIPIQWRDQQTMVTTGIIDTV